MEQQKNSKCRNMMYTQQLSHLPFQLIDLEEKIAALAPEKFAHIIHDKDVNENGKPADAHLHLMMTFLNARSINSVAKSLCDEPQYIERFDRQAENGYAYLIHRTDNAKHKHQYSTDEVISNFDYPAFIEEIESKIVKAARHNQTDLLLDAFKDGYITKQELEEQLTGSEYGKLKSQIENINSVILRQKAERWRKEAIKMGKTLKVYWVYGAAGTGKTSLAKEIILKTNLPLFISGSSRDMFQNYNSEHAIIIDDLRPGTIKYDDLLRLTDPHSIEFGINAPSRYYDKSLACELIAITTPFSPRDFYFHEVMTAEQRRIDTFEQLNRRLSLVLYLDMYYIYRATYNRNTEQFELDKDSKRSNHLSEIARPKEEGERPEDIFDNLFE